MWIEYNGNGLAGDNCVAMPNNLRCLFARDKQRFLKFHKPNDQCVFKITHSKIPITSRSTVLFTKNVHPHFSCNMSLFKFWFLNFFRRTQGSYF